MVIFILNGSFSFYILGHNLMGILAALVLKYLHLYELCILPRYGWIAAFDKRLGSSTQTVLNRILTYYPATE